MAQSSYREALRAAHREALQRDPRVFVMGEDVGRYGGSYAVTKGLLEEFGDARIRDTPLSELGFVGAGIGAALGGLRPIVEVMTVNFSLLALDTIVNTAATLRHMSGGQFSVPLVIRMATGAGRQLGAQHSHSLEVWYAHVPGLRVLAPATLEDARGMLWPALEDPDPVVMFEHAQLYNLEGPVADTPLPVDIVHAAVRRAGTALTIVTYGGSLPRALEAAETLAAGGIDAEVIDLRVLRPLDMATVLASVRKTHRVLVVDEGWRTCSLAAEVLARIGEDAFYDLDAPLARVCSEEVPMPYAKHLEDAALPMPPKIVAAAQAMFARRMIEFRLPSLGSDMDEGKLVEWQVRPGDAVSKGQVVAVVDTAKAAIDVECWHDGIVHALLVEPGATMAVGTTMAVLRAPGESAQAVEQQLAALLAARASMTQPAIAPKPLPEAATPGMSPAPVAARQRISPVARRRAQELGIDATALRGSGADGTVTLDDVEAAVQRQGPPTPAAAPTRAQALRKVIAAAMARSKREIPHYYLAEDIVFERAAAWLAERNRTLPVTQRLLPAALLLKAVAQALQRYPEFNGFYQQDGFVAAAGIHLGVAISLRDGGLVAPALHDVDRMDIATLTRALLDLVKRTRAGALRSSELSDASITVTNLGEQAVASVFGVIYPPQVALVGFGGIGLRPWVGDDGVVTAASVVTASLAADHRSSDGHRGALLLAEIRDRLQDPAALDAPSSQETRR